MGESTQICLSSLLSQVIEINTQQNGWEHTIETIESSKSIYDTAIRPHLALNESTRSLTCEVEVERSPIIPSKANWADMDEDSE